MILSVVLDFDIARWEHWLVPAAGLLSSLAILLIGWRLIRTPALASESDWDGAGQPPDPFIQGSMTERRTSVRRKGKSIKILITNKEGTELPVEAWIVDRSMGGFCMLSERSFDIGNAIHVKVSDGPVEAPWVEAQVRHCQRLKNGWEIGCQFARMPSWNVLLHFG